MNPKSYLLKTAYALALLFLSACTTPPEPDYSPLRAQDSANPTAHTTFLEKQSEKITGMPFVQGNKVELLRDGNATFPAMLEAIKDAKHYIYMESFTFDAKAGRQFAKALVERRKAGVKVDLIYDSFGSSDTPPGIFDYLRRNGVRLVEYNPIEAIDVIDGDADYRDHRKLLVIDGETAFIGGVNISVVYLHKLKAKQFFDPDDANAYKHLPWRDTHIKIMGPSVAEFERVYRHTWNAQHGSEKAFSNWPVDKKKYGDLAVEAVFGAPQNGRFNIYESLLMAITLAQHTVYLTSGYFAPTPGLVELLKATAKRGVDVTLLLPSTSDSDLALEAGHAEYTDLLEAGVKIYEFQGEVLHAKTAVVDGLWSTVGSSNLDWRSAVINNECNAVILGSEFGNQMEDMFKEDLSKSKQIKLEEWENRSFIDRLHEFKSTIISYFL